MAKETARSRPMKKTQQFLAKLKLPTQDNHALEPTKKRFPDGGQYRFEIPSVEGPRVFRAVLTRWTGTLCSFADSSTARNTRGPSTLGISNRYCPPSGKRFLVGSSA